MHKLCFTISLFHVCTCFEHHVLFVRRSKLYYTASGIITLKQLSGQKLLNFITMCSYLYILVILVILVILDQLCVFFWVSPASEFYMPTFRNTLTVPSSQAGGMNTSYHLPMRMEQIECSETSAYKTQTPGNYPKENIQFSEQGESLKARIFYHSLVSV